MTIFSTKVLLATDGSDDAHRALGLVVEITESTNSELHAVHIEDVAAMSEAYAVANYSERAPKPSQSSQARQILNFT